MPCGHSGLFCELAGGVRRGAIFSSVESETGCGHKRQFCGWSLKEIILPYFFLSVRPPACFSLAPQVLENRKAFFHSNFIAVRCNLEHKKP